jgi:hypothetical protein
MAELSDDDTQALMVAAASISAALTDVAEWIKPDAVTTTSLVLVEMIHGMVVAAAAKAAKRSSLDEVVARSNSHTATLAAFHYDKMTAREPQP